MTAHFYCVIRISLRSIQLIEIYARNGSERFTKKVSFSWRRHLERCRNLTPTGIMKKLHDWPLYFSATNHLSRRIIRLVTMAQATCIVLLFPGDHDTHEFSCRLQIFLCREFASNKSRGTLKRTRGHLFCLLS